MAKTYRRDECVLYRLTLLISYSCFYISNYLDLCFFQLLDGDGLNHVGNKTAFAKKLTLSLVLNSLLLAVIGFFIFYKSHPMEFKCS